MLEQIAYEIPRNEQRQPTYFIVGDLESLSASALYYGKAGSGGGSLYIKDLNDGSSLHIHEDDDKITGANIRGKGEKKGYPLSNYEAMMLDLLSGKVTIKNK